jgi:hypothetical protein
MEPTWTHKQQNIEKKERKKGSLTFYRDLVMVPTNSQKQQNKKKKWGAGPCRKLTMATTKTKTKIENKIKKEKRVLIFKLVLPNSQLFKFQALHSSSSKLPKPKCSTC